MRTRHCTRQQRCARARLIGAIWANWRHSTRPSARVHLSASATNCCVAASDKHIDHCQRNGSLFYSIVLAQADDLSWALIPKRRTASRAKSHSTQLDAATLSGRQRRARCSSIARRDCLLHAQSTTMRTVRIARKHTHTQGCPCCAPRAPTQTNLNFVCRVQ